MSNIYDAIMNIINSSAFYNKIIIIENSYYFIYLKNYILMLSIYNF